MKNALITHTNKTHSYRDPFRLAITSPKLWISILWFLILIIAVSYQFWLGYQYNSNETTNLYLNLARGSSYAMLLVLVVLWLPVMRNAIAWLRQSRLGLWLPLNRNHNLHLWLGHSMMALAVLHGSLYLFYYDTLAPPFSDTLLASESDMVRAMQTTMYEFVSEDESIDVMATWISQGSPQDQYETLIQPLLKEDCTKCHSSSSTQTWAVQDLPLSSYKDVVDWTHSGTMSKQFRVNASGLLMLIFALLIWLTALKPIRSKAYHRFQQIHRLGYALAALLILHIPNNLIWLQVPLALLILEVYLSRYKKLYRNCEALLTKVDKDIVRLTIKCPQSFTIKAGHYVQIRIPSLNRQEWHPFSLTGPRESDDQLVLKIRCRGDWTQQLAKLGNSQLKIDLRGPYASPISLSQHSKNNTLMLAAGIGITPFLGLMRAQYITPNTTGNIHLVWVLKEPSLLSWLEPLIKLIAQQPELVCHWHLYLTSSEAHLPEWLNNLPANLHISINQGRPEWRKLLSHIEEHSPTPDCFICGPSSFAKQVNKACRTKRWRVTQEHF